MALNMGYQAAALEHSSLGFGVVLVILVLIFQSIGTCLGFRFDRRIGPGGKRRRR
jgi:D-methionine transport system permease protein